MNQERLSDELAVVKHKLILAVDTQNCSEAETLIAQTQGAIGFYKIGLGLVSVGGIDLAARLAQSGEKIFLDMKLFDIHQTVYNAVKQIADLGVHILTVHGDPHVVEAAAKAKQDSGRKDFEIYAVTVLTSLNQEDVYQMGFNSDVTALVLKRALSAKQMGADGVIASAKECADIKKLCKDLKVITPGIRSMGMDVHDQKRVVTPADAVAYGVDHIVMGRQIHKAESPYHAAVSVLQEMVEV